MASASSSLAVPNVGRASTVRQMPVIQSHTGCRVRGLSAPVLARQSNHGAVIVKNRRGATAVGQFTLASNTRSQWRTYAAATDEPAEEGEAAAIEDVDASGDVDEAELEEEFEYEEAEAIFELSEDELKDRSVLLKQIADASDSAGGLVETSAEQDQTQKENDELVDAWLSTVMEVESMVADGDEGNTDGKLELPFSDRAFYEDMQATLGELKLCQDVAKDLAPDEFNPAKVLYKAIPLNAKVSGYVDGLEEDLKMLDTFDVPEDVEFDEDEQKLLAVLNELSTGVDRMPRGRNPLAELFGALEEKSFTAEEQQLLDSIKTKPARPFSPAVMQELAPYVALTFEACGTPKPHELVQSGATMLNKLMQVAGETPAGEWLQHASDSLSDARNQGKLSADDFAELSAAVSDLQAELNGHTLQVDHDLVKVFQEKVSEVHKYGAPLPAQAVSGAEEQEVAQFLKEHAAAYPEVEQAFADVAAAVNSAEDAMEDEEDVEASIMRAAKALLEPSDYQAFLSEVTTEGPTEEELLDARDILVEAAKKEGGAAAAAKVYGKLTVMAMTTPDETDTTKAEVPEVNLDMAEFLPSAEESENISQLAVRAQLFASSADQLASQNGTDDGWGPEAYLSEDDPVMQEYKNLKARYAEFNINLDEHLAEPSVSQQLRGGASASDIELTSRILKNAAEGKSGAALLSGGQEGSARSDDEEKILEALKELRDQDASFQEVYNLMESGNWEGLDKPLLVPYSDKEQAILAMLDQQPGFSAEAKEAIKAASESVPLEELEEDSDGLEQALAVPDLSEGLVSDLESPVEASTTISEPVTLEELAMRVELDAMVEADEEEDMAEEPEPVAAELPEDTPFDASLEASMLAVDAETLAEEVAAQLGDVAVEDDSAQDAEAALAHAEAAMAEYEALESKTGEDGELTELAKAKLAAANEALLLAQEAADPDVDAFREAADEVTSALAREDAIRATYDEAGIPLPPSVDPDMEVEDAMDFVQAYAKSAEEQVQAMAAKSAKVSTLADAVAAGGAGVLEEIDVDALEQELRAMLGPEQVAAAEVAAGDVDVSTVLAAAQDGASDAAQQAAIQATLALNFTQDELEDLDAQVEALDEEEAQEEEDAADDDDEELLSMLAEPPAEASAADDEETSEDEIEIADDEAELEEDVVTYDGLIAEVIGALDEVEGDLEDEEEAEYLEEQVVEEGDEADDVEEGAVAMANDDDDDADDDEEDEEVYWAGDVVDDGEAEEEFVAEEDAEEDEFEYADADADEDAEILAQLQEDEDEADLETDEAQAALQAVLEREFYDGMEVDEEADEEDDMEEDQAAVAQAASEEDNDDELSTEYNTVESELLMPTFDDIWEEMGVTELRPKEPVKPRPEVEASTMEADEDLDEDAARDALDDDDFEEGEGMEDEVEEDPIAKYYAKGEDDDDDDEEDEVDNAYALTSGLALFGDSPTLGEDDDRAADDATGLLERVTMSKEGDVFVERIIQVGRVTKVVKGGKIMSFRCVAVVGNKNGCVGVGVDSAREVVQAVQKAVTAAKKNLIVVPLTKSDSLPHRVEAKYKSAACVINPAGEGTGCIAGGAVRSVLELAGVKNVLAKRLGSRNPLNNARATIRALEQLQTWGEVAGKRDVSLEYLFAKSSEDYDSSYAAARGAGKIDEASP